MWAALAEFFSQFWSELKFWVIIDQYEAGILMHLGKWKKDLGPGLHWKQPLTEYVMTTTTVITTETIRPQTLTTKDKESIVVTAVVKYEIRKVRAYLLKIWDHTDVLADVTMASVADEVLKHTFDELVDIGTSGLGDIVASTVRSQVNKYGFKIHKVTFTDFGLIKSIRLISDSSSYYLDD